jgi:DNA-binding transcriptional regulator YhcF (GntR family)
VINKKVKLLGSFVTQQKQEKRKRTKFPSLEKQLEKILGVKKNLDIIFHQCLSHLRHSFAE